MFSGGESEAKNIVASIKKQASSLEEYSGKGEEDNSEVKYHGVNPEDAYASQTGGHDSDVTQYSSKSSDSMQHMEQDLGKVAEPESPRRRSTRSKASGKKAS